MEESVVGWLQSQMRERPEAEALVYQKPSGEWIPLSWTELGELVTRVARGFIAQGLAAGQGVALLSQSRMEVPIVQLAAMLAGGRAVTLFPSADPDTIAELVDRSRTHIILVEGKDQFRKLRNHMHLMPTLDTIVYLDEAGDNKKLLTWSQLLARGDGFPLTPLQLRIKDMAGDSPAAILFTPGTMGPVKGVELNQGQLIAGARSLIEGLKIVPGDRVFCPDPPSGAYALLMNLITPIASGATGFAPRGASDLHQTLRYIRPIHLIAGPEIWDGLRAGLMAPEGVMGSLRPGKVDAVFEIVDAEDEARALGKSPSLTWRVLRLLAGTQVYGPVKEALGLEQIRAPISAGGPLRTSTAEFFRHVRVNILEGYGLVEAGGLVTLCPPDAHRVGDLGTPLPGFEISLTDDGEVRVKGSSVFTAYVRDSVDTHLALRDGWLYTGDLGSLDGAGHLRILDRSRDVITTAAGRRLPPRVLEEAITELPEISHALVAASGQRHLVAIVTLDEVRGMAWVRERKANVVTPRELAKYRVFVNYVQSHIATLGQDGEEDGEIKAFKILFVDFQESKGELTPTGDLRRSVLHGRFGEDIRALYGDDWLD